MASSAHLSLLLFATALLLLPFVLLFALALLLLALIIKAIEMLFYPRLRPPSRTIHYTYSPHLHVSSVTPTNRYRQELAKVSQQLPLRTISTSHFKL